MAVRIDDLERSRRINLIGEYFEETGASTRQISAYFSQTQFYISNKTVHEYIQKYKDKRNREKIDDLINKNKGKTLGDDGVIERVFMVSRLVIEGYSMKEISEILDISEGIVKNDIFIRLNKICINDEDLQIYYKVVLKCMHKHTLDALEKTKFKNSINL